MTSRTVRSVAVIGAGPVGLVAAAHLHARGMTPTVFEAGDRVGASISSWGHVRLFSPWRYLVDDTASRLLGASWPTPDPDAIPTGGELLGRFVQPLGAALEAHVRLGSRVLGVARHGMDVMKTPGRQAVPFDVRFRTGDGRVESEMFDAVIDASGTYESPSPLGANGLPALGEESPEVKAMLHYGVPDLGGRDSDVFAGGRVAVVGSGHTAFNALLALASVEGSSDDTHARVTWVVRGKLGAALKGGGEADELTERGQLEISVRQAVVAGKIELADEFRIARVSVRDGGVVLTDAGDRILGPFVRVVVATGYRPDVDVVRELRLNLDPAVEAPSALAPLIDPNLHSCGTVPPHGYRELGHPEPDFFTVGMKSYGRAPTFLLLTGYEQVRSVVAYLAGDLEDAASVKLVLPETGACVTEIATVDGESCCDSVSAL